LEELKWLVVAHNATTVTTVVCNTIETTAAFMTRLRMGSMKQRCIFGILKAKNN